MKFTMFLNVNVPVAVRKLVVTGLLSFAVTSPLFAAKPSDAQSSDRAQAVIYQIEKLKQRDSFHGNHLKPLRDHVKALESKVGKGLTPGVRPSNINGIEGGEWRGVLEVIQGYGDEEARGTARHGAQVQLRVDNEIYDLFFLEFVPDGLQSGVELKVLGYRSKNRIAVTGARIIE